MILGWIGIGCFIFWAEIHPTPLVNAAPWAHGTPDPSATHDPILSGGDTLLLAERVPTYFQDVEPIIEARCTMCHLADKIGHATFPLMDYPDVLEYAEDIELAVSTRYMPPWMPSKESPAFQHERRLSDAELLTLTRWFENDLPLGDIEQRTIAQFGETLAENTITIRPDLALTMPQVYTPDPTLTDDYRCFLIDPGIDRDSFVTGYDILPGNTALVHHVIIYQAPASARREAEIKSGRDGRPGWQCFGDTNLSSGGDELSYMIGAWTPGSMPVQHAPGVGVPLPADNLIVLQVHYNTAAGVGPDQTTIHLQLADEANSIEPLLTFGIFGPVELPCPPGIDGPACDRSNALRDAGDYFSTTLLSRCGADWRDFANQPADQITSTCDVIVPISATIYGVMGHMHQLGKSTRLELNPGLDDAIILLDIPAWDFHWQGSYQLVEPIEVTVGDTLRLTCVWDNSEGERYVVWGDRTQDEMCLNFISFKPRLNR
jgi:hypothetical protein